MKSIQILGPGCAKCTRLAEYADDAAKSLGIEYKVEKITDINQIMAYGIMMTPGLVIDGKLISSGRLMKPDEIKKYLI